MLFSWKWEKNWIPEAALISLVPVSSWLMEMAVEIMVIVTCGEVKMEG